MKKRNDLPKALLLGLIVVWGCDTGLDSLPKGSVAEEIFWQRERDAILAVNAVYNELDGVQMVKELDGVTDIGYRAPSGPGTFHDVGAGNIDPSNSAITSNWNRYYRGIRKANDVINNIGSIEDGDPALLERLEAEARFLRAWYYTQLTSLWGDVPLITETIGINDHVGRTPRAEIVAFIHSELDSIINANVLELSYSDSDLGRATHGAALTLKARLALRNSDWETVRDATQAVMDLGIYSLYPDYVELFQYAGQNSSEVIFDRQYAVGGDTYNAFSYSAGSIGGSSVVEPVRALQLMYEYTGPVNPDDPYENLDPRWGHIVYYTGQPIGNSTYNSWPGSPTGDEVMSAETATQHGYNLKKWVDYPNDSANPANGSINMILMRYADVLLMYAEAKVELNEIDETVYAALNEIRERPTVGLEPISAETHPGQEELRAYIRDERARELAFEGLRLYDINRWQIGEVKEGIVQGMDYINPSTGEWEIWDRNFNRSFRPDRDYLWPIPQSEMEINSAITSNNPGYGGSN